MIIHKKISANKTLCASNDGRMIYLSSQVTCKDCKELMIQQSEDKFKEEDFDRREIERERAE